MTNVDVDDELKAKYNKFLEQKLRDRLISGHTTTGTCSYIFRSELMKEFCKRNNISSVCKNNSDGSGSNCNKIVASRRGPWENKWW